MEGRHRGLTAAGVLFATVATYRGSVGDAIAPVCNVGAVAAGRLLTTACHRPQSSWSIRRTDLFRDISYANVGRHDYADRCASPAVTPSAFDATTDFGVRFVEVAECVCWHGFGCCWIPDRAACLWRGHVHFDAFRGPHECPSLDATVEADLSRRRRRPARPAPFSRPSNTMHRDGRNQPLGSTQPPLDCPTATCIRTWKCGALLSMALANMLT